mgnify:CR=1 FL=1
MRALVGLDMRRQLLGCLLVGPIVLLALYWRRLTATGALAGMVVGAVTVFVWGNIDSLSDRMYEIVPGFALNLLVAVVVSLLRPTTDPKIAAEFDRMEQELADGRGDVDLARQD